MTECDDATTEQERPDDAAPGGTTVPDDTMPEGSGGDGREELEAVIATWRRELGDQVSVPASLVQDHLLDLWGLLPEGASRAEVESWLVETLQRHLYQVDEVARRLDTVLA